MVRNIFIATICFFFCFSVQAKEVEKEDGERLILNLVGTGKMYENTVPDIDGDGVDDRAMCFDVNVFNVKNNKMIGRGTDCLAMVTPTDAGVALVGTTYFYLPSGKLVTRGKTSVQPVFHPTTTPSGQSITHITGASSDGNSVIDGTGRFANANGTVRLSGMVNMEKFLGNVGDPITFDCLFVIDLNHKNHD
ncbi:MAG TPA: hypothetical protein PLP93_11160 [Nitrosomonas sp.]|nr:hypothetical protein [Nitrosomonas sp.]HRB46396.1 hypothetical protein [Nitrosomonas sp.]HRB78292.1 hypothetical protein [Nitrosomonas sp.]